ncbi:MAG: hypothetical protein CVV23_14710 [Ignavibacteriae bacterium HGW-Ignavibacteriae-2]|nr:MAG: hypothetical protein CVV23_14710 [Ignavibacteriae bacterium HGW-Ignavibacteriae-2]
MSEFIELLVRCMLKLIYKIPILLMILSCSRENVFEPNNNGLPPNQPVGLRFYFAHDGEIGFEWTKNQYDAVDHYNIYRGINDSINLNILDKTTNNYFEDYYLHYDSTYNYAVAAVNKFGLESPRSKTISTKPINKYKPYPPYQISINAQNWLDTLSVKLSWYPSYDTDIKGYIIYRDTTTLFDLKTLPPLEFTNKNYFVDTNHLKILKMYYYKIIAVDNGDLTSSSTFYVSDMIYDRPQPVFPTNNSQVKNFTEFEFKSISVPAKYKLVIQRNKLFDVIYQKEFSITKINSNIKVTITPVSLELYKNYYWRIITYSNEKLEPNSFSDLNCFSLIP